MPFHILYLHQYFCPPGGHGNNRSFQFSTHWVNAGKRVTVLTSPAYFPNDWISRFSAKKVSRKLYFFQINGIDVWVVNIPYSHFMPFHQRILAFLRFYFAGKKAVSQLEKPDVIYASSTPPTVGELGRKLSDKWKIPYVFEVVDVWPDVPQGMGILKNKMLLNWLHKKVIHIYIQSSAIITLSPGMKTQIRTHGIADEKIHVIHNGTDPELIQFKSRLPGKICRVIYSGTIGIANGLDQIVKVAELLQSRKDIHFVLLGNGNDLVRIKQLASTKNLTNLEFKTQVSKQDANDYLESADIGLVCFAPFPVLEANSANKFFDYLASGIPVVINYKGWQAFELEQANAGLSSKQGDINAFADNIIHLADHPEMRIQLAENGRRLAEEKFDRKKGAQTILELLLETNKNNFK